MVRDYIIIGVTLSDRVCSFYCNVERPVSIYNDDGACFPANIPSTMRNDNKYCIKSNVNNLC